MKMSRLAREKNLLVSHSEKDQNIRRKCKLFAIIFGKDRKDGVLSPFKIIF